MPARPSAPSRSSPWSPSSEPADVRVELLYAEGDPAAMAARQNLVEVLTEDAFETPIQMIVVASTDDAILLEMRGSPMIRIDGVDIVPDWDGPAGLEARDYRDGPL